MFLDLLPRGVTRRAATVLATLAASIGSVLAQAPTDGFAPDVDGNVFAVATQSDGKIIVGGQFSTINSSNRRNLARLNPDGSVDNSFNPSANGPVRAIVIQPDGQIVIGGDFTSLQPGGSGAATTRLRAARLNENGTIDARFNPSLGGERQPQVHALLLQPDGRIIIGGSFTTAQPGGTGATATRQRLARFNADGSLDASFDPGPNGMVLALALHTDGRILVGGGFTGFQRAGQSDLTGRSRIARLNRDGTVDASFDANANNAVTTIAVQRDGRILLGGQFTTLHPIGDENPSSRARLGRLLADGTLDYDFVATVNGPVARIAVQPDGAILVGGTFNTAWGRGGASAGRNNIARFFPDGSVDPNFSPNVNSQVAAIAFQPDGKIVLGGYFTRVQARGATTGLVRNRLARFAADGSLDTAFALDPGGRVLASAVQSDGKILIAGSFRNVGGATRNYFARLNADGSLDTAYNPDFNDRVYTIAVQSDGKAVVGGAFTTAGGETRNHIARLNTNGSVDSSFTPSIDGTVGVILIQSDGRILAGGTFTTVTATGDTASTLRTNLLRLNANGSLDTGFNPGPNSSVAAMALQSDGKIVLGGAFSVLTPTSGSPTGRNFFARINGDGTVDAPFAPALNGRVSAIVVQPDGKIVVAGAFTGVVSSGASESVVRNRIARFNGDGTLDTAFNPNPNDNVLALALQPDGKLIIGGAFTTLQPNDAPDWTLRKYAARLNADGTVDSSFNLDINEAAGNRVDSLRLADGRLLIGGSFASFHPAGTPARIDRPTFARINTTSGAVDAGFNFGAATGARGQIHALAIQPDNKIVAVGAFTDLGGARTTNIARFNPEGAADPTFGPTITANGAIRAVALRSEAAVTPSHAPGFAWLNRSGALRDINVRGASRLSGSINVAVVHPNGGVLLGGAFTNLANTTGGNLVRLNADGSLDTNFSPAPNGAVTAIAIQPDGRVVIAGTFSLVHGAVRNRIARLNTDGTLDNGFDPNASGAINAVVAESDGRLIVGGAFTSFLPNATTTSVARNYLARINNDGTIDANYSPNPNAIVYALALQGDGRVIAGGAFTGLQPGAATTGTTRNNIARINADGTLDTNFDPNINGPVVALAVQPNGQVVVGGQFTTVGGGSAPYLARNNVARVNADGIGDANFNPNVNAVVRAVAVQPDGGVLLAGDFTTVQANDAPVAVARTGLARVTSSGALDVDFDPDLNGAVAGVTARPDGTVLVTGNFTGLQISGSIVVGGDFTTVGGLPRRNLAALTGDGGVSTAFQPNPNGAVNALLAQPDGKLLVGGAFTSIGGATRNRLARFNADGTLDTSFNPAIEFTVNALALQPDGRVIVAGEGVTAGAVIRVNADGSRDATFTAPPDVTYAVALQPDGRIIIESLYQLAGQLTTRSLRRLNASGAVDETFSFPLASGSVGLSLLAVQADGRIFAVGRAGGANTGRVFLLERDGAVNPSFDPGVNGAVTAAALQSDGRLVIGGGFTSVAGQQRFGIARLAPTAPVTDVLGISADGTTVRWLRGGSAAELAGVSFEISTDRTSWRQLGLATRTAEGWSLSGVSLPANDVFYIRARAIAPSSGGTSSGVFELIREFTLAAGAVGSAGPVIAANGLSYDPHTGLISRHPASTVTLPPGVASIVTGDGDTIEIVAASLQPGAGIGRLANLSTRARVTAENPLILGFAVAGSESRTLLVRAIGPALAGFGVGDALAGTRLQIHDSSGAVIVANESWETADGITQVSARSGAFPLAAGSADSAAVVTLAPGVYTMQIVDTAGAGGIALAEIYDADTRTSSRLVNVSSRGGAGLGGDALISGFVISGDAPKRVLLRAVGPTLAEFGATNVVADPSIALYNSAGLTLGSNDNWVGVSQLVTAATSAGAFPLAAGSKDAAVIATLPPGAYTIQVSGRDGSGGAALLEVYELPY